MEACNLRTTRASGVFEKASVQKILECPAALWDSALGLGCFQEKKDDIFGKEYAVLESFADFVVPPAPGRYSDALGRPATIPIAHVPGTPKRCVLSVPGRGELRQRVQCRTEIQSLTVV